MCEIVMLIFGIIALVRGRFAWTRGTEVYGWPARIAGLVLLTPWPLAFVVGMVLGAIFMAQGKEVDSPEFKQTARVLGVIIVVACFILAIGIAKVYAKPIRKERYGENDDAPQIPRHYGERFAAEQEGNSARPDALDRPPRSSTQQEDRIQE